MIVGLYFATSMQCKGRKLRPSNPTRLVKKVIKDTADQSKYVPQQHPQQGDNTARLYLPLLPCETQQLSRDAELPARPAVT